LTEAEVKSYADVARLMKVGDMVSTSSSVSAPMVY